LSRISWKYERKGNKNFDAIGELKQEMMVPGMQSTQSPSQMHECVSEQPHQSGVKTNFQSMITVHIYSISSGAMCFPVKLLEFRDKKRKLMLVEQRKHHFPAFGIFEKAFRVSSFHKCKVKNNHSESD